MTQKGFVTATLLLVLSFGTALADGNFKLQEATIKDIHTAIQGGELTCKGLIEAYIKRARAYNGVCTALVTKDGADVAPAKGKLYAGVTAKLPTRTVAISSVVPDFDQYKGLPIEYGRVEPTLSDPSVMQQYGMRVGIPDAGQVNALETINIRGERSVSCKAACDAHPSTGALPKSCPSACETFRQLPDALERAAELDKQYGKNPDLKSLPLYCTVFSVKNWYDAKDMRGTGGNDINYAMDVPKYDSPDVAALRKKGAIIYAIASASSTGTSKREGAAKLAKYIPDNGFQDAAWGGQACNPYDTSRVPRGTSNGSGVSVSTNLVNCSICEQTSASCKGPASRNNVVNLLTTKGIMQDGGPGYSDSGDRAGIHCRTLGDAVTVLDAIKGFKSEDLYTAIPKGIIPDAPYASAVVGEKDVNNKPLKGMRIAFAREFMVKHVKNDATISDMIDKEVKTVLRDRLGAELVETVDPLYPDDPTVPNIKYTFQDAFAEILPQVAPEYFWLLTSSGEPEFAVPGYDVRSTNYALALALGKAPLSPKINLRRISGSGLGNPDSTFLYDKYLALRGDTRVNSWAAWVANSKWKSDAQRVGAENAVGDQDPREDPGTVSYLKMQSVLRLVVLKVMQENGIDAFVNPEQTTPPYKLGGAQEPVVNSRAAHSCCAGFTALLGGPEVDIPAGYTTTVFNPQYVLNKDKTRYEAVTGTIESKLEHPMPISLMIWAGPGYDSTVIKAGSAYEAVTHHRKPPPGYGPVAGEP